MVDGSPCGGSHWRLLVWEFGRNVGVSGLARRSNVRSFGLVWFCVEREWRFFNCGGFVVLEVAFFWGWL